MKHLAYVLLALVCVSVAVSACKDDDYVYPSVVTEFITMETDEEGTVSKLVRDDGTELNVIYRSGLSGLVTDTAYRTVSMYLPSEEDESYVTLYTCTVTKSPIPQPRSFFHDTVFTDPVDIEMIRRSGDYIDMTLLVKLKEKVHVYNFIHEGISTNDAGGKTLQLRLYHNQKDDVEAFTEDVYMSVPLWAYKDSLSTGDSIEFLINTYEEGETARYFVY